MTYDLNSAHRKALEFKLGASDTSAIVQDILSQDRRRKNIVDSRAITSGAIMDLYSQGCRFRERDLSFNDEVVRRRGNTRILDSSQGAIYRDFLLFDEIGKMIYGGSLPFKYTDKPECKENWIIIHHLSQEARRNHSIRTTAHSLFGLVPSYAPATPHAISP